MGEDFTEERGKTRGQWQVPRRGGRHYKADSTVSTPERSLHAHKLMPVRLVNCLSTRQKDQQGQAPDLWRTRPVLACETRLPPGGRRSKSESTAGMPWTQRVGESAAPSVLLSRTRSKEEFRQNEAGEGSHRGVVSRQIVDGTTVRDATGFWVVAGAASDYGKWWILVASFVLFLSRDALLRMSAAA